MPAINANFMTYDGDAASMAYTNMNPIDGDCGVPFSNEARINLTDAYQIRMSYAYWKSNKHEQHASFEVFYRTAPFGGQFVVLAGVDEVIRAVNIFRFAETDIDYIRESLSIDDEEFFAYLRTLDTSSLTIHSQLEGSIVFPKTPLLQVTGPLILCQLVETLILNLMNFPSLIATNAMRMRLEAGPIKKLVEFGLRRAQGPDGAMSASRYSYLGGFDGTSNVRAAQIFGLPIMGTHAHSFVTTFQSDDMKDESFCPTLPCQDGHSFKARCVRNRRMLFEKCSDILGCESETNSAEFAAFIAFAAAYPDIFIALVDTYDTLASGLPNFLAVYMTLQEYYQDKRGGVRLDSGDLAYLSKKIRKIVHEVSDRLDLPRMKHFSIFASNDINEKILKSLNDQKHEIDAFGIGTNLVTCQAQPALGLVYKMTSIDGRPTLKLSENIEKVSIPCVKALYRFYNENGEALMDYLVRPNDEIPVEGERVFARHLMSIDKRCYVVPHRVEEILILQFAHGKRVLNPTKSYIDYLTECRHRAVKGIQTLRPDILRSTFPSVYKVSTSEAFFQEMKDLRLSLTPIKTIQ